MLWDINKININKQKYNKIPKRQFFIVLFILIFKNTFQNGTFQTTQCEHVLKTCFDLN